MTDRLPFDPATTGPLDLAAAGVDRVRAFVHRNEREVIAGVIAIVVLQVVAWGMWDLWFLRLPQLPDWFLVGIGAMIFFTPFALPLGWTAEKWIGGDETVLISVQSAVTGDQEIKHLTPAAFDEMTILDVRGDERGRDYLEVVRINGRRAYEVQKYDAENNTALASSMAGRSNAEIRRDREEIGSIKTELVREADKAVEFMVRASGILRKQGEQVANEIIRVAEDVELPQGSRLHDTLIEERRSADPTDDLLGGGYDPDDDEEDDSSETDDPLDELNDIFARAAEMQGDDEAIADGGRSR